MKLRYNIAVALVLLLAACSVPGSTPESKLEGNWKQLAAGPQLNLVFFEDRTLEVGFYKPDGTNAVVCDGDYTIEGKRLRMDALCQLTHSSFQIVLEGQYELDGDKLVLTEVQSLFNDEEGVDEGRMVFERQ